MAEVVYPNRRPRLRKKLADPGGPRDTISYVVCDALTGKYYWPRAVGTLEARREDSNDG